MTVYDFVDVLVDYGERIVIYDTNNDYKIVFDGRAEDALDEFYDWEILSIDGLTLKNAFFGLNCEEGE